MKLNKLLATINTGENRWLIENLIPMGELAILYAKENLYKTFLSLKIALEVATGSQELGATESGCVYLISLEGSAENYLHRIEGLHQAKYMNHDIGSSLDINFTNPNLTADLPNFEEQGILDQYTWSEWGKKLNDDGVKLIIIDTLSKTLGSNSVNDDKALRIAINNLESLIAGTCISVLVIAHASYKNPSKGIMGTSIQHNDFQTILKVKKTKSGLCLYREKIQCSAEGSSIPFKMRSILVDNEETLYAEIGKEFSGFQAEILRLYTNGFDKEEIKSETHKIYGGNYETHRVFTVSFNRYWRNLIKQGFIKEVKHETKGG